MTLDPRRFARWSFSLAAILCALTLARVARADEYDATFTRAIAAKERALDKNDPAAFEEALELFQQADRIRSTKEAKYELASAAARLRQDDLAVEGYAAALELGLGGTAAEKARAFVDQKRAEMATLTVTGPEGTELYVGARRRGILPLARPIVVFAGKARIRAGLSDGREVVQSLVLAKGESRAINLNRELARTPGEPIPPPVTPPTNPPVTTPPTTEPSRALPSPC